MSTEEKKKKTEIIKLAGKYYHELFIFTSLMSMIKKNLFDLLGDTVLSMLSWRIKIRGQVVIPKVGYSEGSLFRIGHIL